MWKWLMVKRLLFKYEVYKWWHDRLPCWVAFHLPRKVQYRCAINVGAKATTGQYSDQIVPELRFVEALERWDNAV